ncbi:endonuclease III domain-containing protein [Chitinivibrio alkaliphilus]|uniref:Endonuclease III n=1 Tax=Chitinivibrio alkaliphilus ACht1 TaxID=1313304 RepID=U7D7R9_9BACT|nr:endonuclease III [Chitinivibrio alkaliphilus]ERP39000.1 endonuclease III [Chitinivibrio alkaliphilus ACht1]
MNKEERLARIYTYLERLFYSHKMPVIDLMKVGGESPFRLLVATILSSRTKDEVTSQAAARLFEKADTLEALARLSESEIAQRIYPVGFYKTKARHLRKLPEVVLHQFGGIIPHTMDELVCLPGVGRKTAALVAATAFDQDTICVDTHVHRITNRLGFVSTKTPAETERALMEYLPVQYWKKTNAYFVSFGQNICRPVGPRCTECSLQDLCPYYAGKDQS